MVTIVNLIQSPLHRILASTGHWTPDEADFVRDLHRRRRTVPRGTELVSEGCPVGNVFVVAEGWACMLKVLPNGNRQILDVRLPGDAFCLLASTRDIAPYSVQTLTASEVCEISRAEYAKINSPRVLDLLAALSARDEAILFEHIANIGRRDALSRVAHFALELGVRLAAASGTDPLEYDCPLGQTDFADALGISSIYLNRCFRILRERGLMRVLGKKIIIDDRTSMIRLTGFDADYIGLSTVGQGYSTTRRCESPLYGDSR